MHVDRDFGMPAWRTSALPRRGGGGVCLASSNLSIVQNMVTAESLTPPSPSWAGLLECELESAGWQMKCFGNDEGLLLVRPGRGKGFRSTGKSLEPRSLNDFPSTSLHPFPLPGLPVGIVDNAFGIVTPFIHIGARAVSEVQREAISRFGDCGGWSRIMQENLEESAIKYEALFERSRTWEKPGGTERTWRNRYRIA